MDYLALNEILASMSSAARFHSEPSNYHLKWSRLDPFRDKTQFASQFKSHGGIQIREGAIKLVVTCLDNGETIGGQVGVERGQVLTFKIMVTCLGELVMRESALNMAPPEHV